MTLGNGNCLSVDRHRQRAWRHGALLVLGCRRPHHRRNLSWGTLIVNVTGSLLIGVIAALTAPDGRIFLGSTARLALMAGFCGGYTTFSSFSLQDGDWWRAAANIVVSVLLCLLAVWAGYAAASSFNALR